MLTNTEICIVSEQAVMIQCIWYDFIFLNNEVHGRVKKKSEAICMKILRGIISVWQEQRQSFMFLYFCHDSIAVS